MIRVPPRYTRTDTLFPYTTLIRSLDLDSGYWSSEFFSRLAGSPNVREVVRLNSRADLHDAIDNRRVIAAIAFDQDFSADIAAGRPATIQAIFDGRRSNAAQIVAGYLARIAADVGADVTRSEERRVGKECVRTWRNRGTP